MIVMLVSTSARVFLVKHQNAGLCNTSYTRDFKDLRLFNSHLGFQSTYSKCGSEVSRPGVQLGVHRL